MSETKHLSIVILQGDEDPLVLLTCLYSEGKSETGSFLQ